MVDWCLFVFLNLSILSFFLDYVKRIKNLSWGGGPKMWRIPVLIGRGDACQRSLRNRPRSGSRLLQSSFPGGEGIWRLETRDRSQSPERVRPSYSVQDGNSRFCTVICQRGRFSSFPGSEKCVLLDPNPSTFEEAIEVHIRGDGLPVPSPVFRTVDCFPGLHRGLRSRVSVGTLPQDQTSPLSERLVDSYLFRVGSQSGRPVAPLTLSHPRDCDKREEVESRALADCEVSRDDHQYWGRQGFSVSGASREIPDSSWELFHHGHSPRLSFGRWSSVTWLRSSGWFLTVAFGCAPCSGIWSRIDPWVRPSLSSGAFATGSETGPVLVDGEGSSVDGGSIRDACSRSSPVFGCVLFGVGRSPPRSTRVWGVVRPGKVASHQSSRDEGTVLGPSGISRRCHRSSRDSDVRQPDGRGVHQQARGHGFPGSMLVGQPPSEMDGEFRHPSRCEVSSRTSQYTGRSPQPSQASCRDTVVSPPSGGEVATSRLGQSVDRPVCDEPQRETAHVLLARPGSPGRLRGCVSSSLGRPGPVHIPSLSFGWSGDRPCLKAIAGRDDSGRTPLAREGVVPRLAASTDPTTSRPALVGQPASAAPMQPLPPRRPRAEPSCVATLKCHFRKSGFSRRAARVLSGCLRSSTSRLYRLRWQIFWCWRRGRGVAPVNATVPVVVNFLIHLRHDKGLSVSAVKGYSSALNSVLALKGRDLASSREITMFLRSFSRSVDLVELRPPAWDVALVLQSLTGAPYEPLRTCDEHFLAQKTLFLLALASAKRIGELHALSYRVSFQGLGWGVLFFRPGLRGKDSGSLFPCSSVWGLYCTGPTKREK